MPCKLYTASAFQHTDDRRLSVHGRRLALCVAGDWSDIERIVRTGQQEVRQHYGSHIQLRSLGRIDGWANIGDMERDNPGLEYVLVMDVESIMNELDSRGLGQPPVRRSAPAPVYPAVEPASLTAGQDFSDRFYWLEPEEQDRLMEGATITLRGDTRTREIQREGTQQVRRISGPFVAINTLEMELRSAYWMEPPPGLVGGISARNRRAGLDRTSPPRTPRSAGRRPIAGPQGRIPGPPPGAPWPEPTPRTGPPSPPPDILPRTVRRQFVEDPEPEREVPPGVATEEIPLSVTPLPVTPRLGLAYVEVQTTPATELETLTEQALEVMAQLNGYEGGASIVVTDVDLGIAGIEQRALAYREVPAHREEAVRIARTILIMRAMGAVP